MSTSTAEPPVAQADSPIPTVTPAAVDEPRTYRGRTLEELLPKIREELGADAVVVRQRDGLMGGIGGFFQQRFVEVEARAGHPRVDLYDEPPTAADFARQLAAAEEQAEPVVTAAPFADALPVASELPAPAPPPLAPAPPAPAPPTFDSPTRAPAADVAAVLPAFEPPAFAAVAPAADFAAALPVANRPAPPAPPERALPAVEPAAPEPRAASKPRARRAPRRPTATLADPPRAHDDAEGDELVAALTARGLSDAFARALVADAAAHLLPFTPGGDLRAAVLDALARRIPVAPLPAAGGRSVAFAGTGGAGKTRCVAALAAAHAQAGVQPVRCLTLVPEDGGAELTRLLAPHGVKVQAVATPSAARTALDRAPADALVVLDTPAVSPGDPNAIERLAARLARIGLDEIQLALPATLSAAAAREQCERLAPLAPSGIALTHADVTDHVGALVELACTTRLPLASVADGLALPGGLAPADATRIAERLLR